MLFIKTSVYWECFIDKHQPYLIFKTSINTVCFCGCFKVSGNLHRYLEREINTELYFFIFIFWFSLKSARQGEQCGSFTLVVTQSYALNSFFRVLQRVYTEKNSCGKLQNRIIQSPFTQSLCSLYSPKQYYTVSSLNITY